MPYIRSLKYDGAASVYRVAVLLASSAVASIAWAQEVTPNLVIQWNNAALQAVRNSKLGPPMAARALAIFHTCIYDAWAAYDQRALGTQLGSSLRRSHRERTLANKNKAISFAAYRAAADLFPADDEKIFRPLMEQLGYIPDDTPFDTRTPSGIGKTACDAVLQLRHQDGSNQSGELSGSGVPYADYTGYAPLNNPSPVPSDPATVRDPNHWQPLQYFDASHVFVTQSFVGAQWYLVTPFALRSNDQFRSELARFGPATCGSSAFLRQVDELVEKSANLTDRQKMIAEYFADGPHSELPPGHWDLFAQFVSARDHHGVDEDARLFFALTNAIFDAGIVAWDAKHAFDSVRPATAVPYVLQGQQIEAWGGPGKGTVRMDGRSWIPYQLSTFPTPPFPEYISGHSTFSAAGAAILRLFTGSDVFGDSVTFPPGSSKIEPGLTPLNPVTLYWKTFTDAANQAGISRQYGGIHFKAGDLIGRAVGRIVGYQAWSKAEALWNGRTREFDRRENYRIEWDEDIPEEWK
jgi:PAP2 superfamily